MQDFFCLAAEAAAEAIQLGRTFAIKSIPSFIHFAVSCKSICSVFFSAHNCHPFMHMFVLCSAHTIFFYLVLCSAAHNWLPLTPHLFVLWSAHKFLPWMHSLCSVFCTQTPFLNASADAEYVWENVRCFLVCFYYNGKMTSQCFECFFSLW